MSTGLFVTIEGPEGAGKSTLQKNMASVLRASGHEVVETREPGGTPLGKTIRSMLLTPAADGTKIDAKSELLLFLVDRAHHVLEVIKPALHRGAIVLCDRFIHSTIAYQGYGRGMDIATLRSLNEFTIGSCAPDIVLLLDLDPEKGLQRAQDHNRFEHEQLDFHRRVRQGFLELAKAEAEKFTVLDAMKSPEELTSAAVAAVQNRLK